MRTHIIAAMVLAGLWGQFSSLLAQEVESTQQYMERARGGADFPQVERGVRLLEREAEVGNFGPLDPVIAIPTRARYLITYMKSRTEDSIRSATVASVTNQTDTTCRVTVSYFKGLTNDSSPACSTTFSIPSELTVDYCSRDLPGALTTCNSTCNPALTFDEGRAIVSSTCRDIGVSARVYYTSGDADDRVDAITDSKVVRYDEGNKGD